jgi:hypothetical protein
MMRLRKYWSRAGLFFARWSVWFTGMMGPVEKGEEGCVKFKI